MQDCPATVRHELRRLDDNGDEFLVEALERRELAERLLRELASALARGSGVLTANGWVARSFAGTEAIT